MKKHSFLPLLLVAPLLVGCGEVKEPKFASEGSEVDYEKFGEDFVAALNENEFSKEDKVGSMVAKGSGKQKVTFTKSINGKEKDRLVISVEKTSNLKADTNNHVATIDERTSETMSNSDSSSSQKIAATVKTQQQIQEGTYDGKSYAFLVDKKLKTFKSAMEIPDGSTMADTFDLAVKSAAAEYYAKIYTVGATYASASEEEKANYKFYENNKIFTISYKKEVKDKEWTNSDLEVYKVSNETKIEKWQIDLTNGAFAYRHYYNDVDKDEYKMNYYSSYVKGEIQETKQVVSEEIAFKSKNVKLKKVSLDKYAPLGF